MGTLTWEVDPERHIMIIRLVGDLDGWAVRARMDDLWHAQPACIASHCIIDMRNYIGDLHYDDLFAIAARWRKLARGRDVGCGTAIVTHDRFARFLMNAVAVLFPTRRFALFVGLEDAMRWLEATSERPHPSVQSADEVG